MEHKLPIKPPVDIQSYNLLDQDIVNYQLTKAGHRQSVVFEGKISIIDYNNWMETKTNVFRTRLVIESKKLLVCDLMIRLVVELWSIHDNNMSK